MKRTIGIIMVVIAVINMISWVDRTVESPMYYIFVILILVSGLWLIISTKNKKKFEQLENKEKKNIPPFISTAKTTYPNNLSIGQQIFINNYSPQNIQRTGLQVLETIYIINTSKALDTITGRYVFLISIIDTIKQGSSNARYLSDIQIAIDRYKSMYYDRILEDYQIAFLLKPKDFDLIDYYCSALFCALKRNYDVYKEEVNILKREDSKIRRKAKIKELIIFTQSELTSRCSSALSFKATIAELEKLEIILLSETSNPQLKAIQLPIIKPLISSSGIIINPDSNFKLTLYNSPNEVIQQVKNILTDENTLDKEKLLMPLFTQYNIKCREIDEYVSKYKSIYLAKVEELKNKSSEYQNASEMDKQDIGIEFYQIAANSLYENIGWRCDVDLLFLVNEINFTLDDELIKEYGFEVISKYTHFAFDIEKVRIDYERKDFEELIKCGLAISGEEIPLIEVLKQQPLKVLNKIANKEEGFYKRKDKAIDFILADENLKNETGKHISMRRIFKLKPLPDKYSKLSLIELSNSWRVVKEQIKLIVYTYLNSERYTEEIKGDLSWAKGFQIEKQEDFNSEFICLRARAECKKKFSKNSPPKLPFHIGCNCYLHIEM